MVTHLYKITFLSVGMSKLTYENNRDWYFIWLYDIITIRQIWKDSLIINYKYSKVKGVLELKQWIGRNPISECLFGGEREREHGGRETERAEAVHRVMQVQSLTPPHSIPFLLQGLSPQVSLSSHFSSLSPNSRSLAHSLTLSLCCSLGARIPPQPKTVSLPFPFHIFWINFGISVFHYSLNLCRNQVILMRRSQTLLYLLKTTL